MFVKQKTKPKDAAPLLQPTAVRSDVESNEIWGFPSKPGLQRRSSVASGMNAAQRLKEIMTLQRALLADALAVVRVVSFSMLTTSVRWRKISRTSSFTLLSLNLWRRTIGRSKIV